MTPGASWSRPRVEGQDQSGKSGDWGFYSEGHCDCSAFALEVGWYRRTPIPRVAESSEEILQLALLST